MNWLLYLLAGLTGCALMLVHLYRVHQAFVRGWRKGLRDAEAARKSWVDLGVPPDSEPWWILHGPDVPADER